MHVFNIPASAPFLRTLVAALIDGRLVAGFEARHAPERLAEATLYLPTRRAGRLARDIFLDEPSTDAAILPRIVALGDTDEEELLFAQAASPDTFANLDIARALDGLPRRLQLAQLISAWARRIRPGDPSQAPLVVGGPASTLALADDLARLMDDMATREVDWRALKGLVPDALDTYWQITLDFLQIAARAWPDHLKENGLIEPAARRDALIAAEAARLQTQTHGPVIAAASTASMPSTAKLLHAIAQLPMGAVVLPGLDTDLDEAAWQAIGGIDDAHPASNHPQYALHGLLDRFAIRRSDVIELTTPAPHGRELLLSETMRPSGETARWHHRLAEPTVDAQLTSAMHGVAIVAADNPEMEALAIAVAMREAHEHDLSCALVTPDRALARRVIAALGRWNLAFDDSGGDALTETAAGIFARLAAQAIADGLAPAELLALLKHPLFRLGRDVGGWRREIETLELAVLRGPRPAPGCAALAQEIASLRDQLARRSRGEATDLHGSDPRLRLRDGDLADVAALVEKLAAALSPLESIPRFTPQDFSDLARCHRDVVSALSADGEGLPAAFDGAAGSALALAFDEVADSGPSHLAVTLRDYAEVFETAFADRVVRRPPLADAKLRIFGPLEARLTHSDRVILGGLVESVWPPAPRTDPWLSRPMRHQLGLDLPERRIGLSAHDFAQMFGARDILLTHAAKSGGTPTVASRFLHRLEAVAGETRWREATARGALYLDCAHALDHPDKVAPAPQPKPVPPRAARPLRLSVTAIEELLRDPYSIYARYVLDLRGLDPVDMPLSGADRGSAIHGALAQFVRAHPDTLPDDIPGELRGIGEIHFKPLMQRPEAQALWWPRFLRIAAWIAGWETERRSEARHVVAEVDGKIAIALDGGRSFTLTARADRIEHRRDGTYAILDYKTGAPPSDKQVRLGLSPQLTLEAAILRGGGIDGIAAGASVSEIVYLRLSGNDPAGKETVLPLKAGRGAAGQMPDEAADQALANLTAVIRRFDDEAWPYASLVLPMWKNRYGGYDDLARIKEWSVLGREDDA